MNSIQNYGVNNYQVNFQAKRTKELGNLTRKEYKEFKAALNRANKLIDKPEHMRTKKENRIAKFYEELCQLIK